MGDLVAVVQGTVQHGDSRGRELGFPTANVWDPEAVRLDGVYAGILQVEPAENGPSFVTAVSVGHRPTFYGRDALRLLEAHLLDFAGDLYERHVRIELHTRLRPQRKYIDKRTLVRQLRVDVEATRAWALANGLDRLLGEVTPSDSLRPSTFGGGGATRSRPVIRGKKRDGFRKSVERQKRRERQIVQAINEREGREDLSPEWLAQRVGVPIGHARWYLGSLED